MRFLALVFVLGCGAGSREPAWPKPHEADNDGGESLAPHGSRSAVAAAVVEDDDKPAVEAKPAEARPASDAKPAAPASDAPAAAAPADETLQTEEIIIEVDD